MRLVASVIALLLPLAALGAATPLDCRPCGQWQLDASASEAAGPAIDAAMARYKPPRPRRFRSNSGDVALDTEAEFQASLEERHGPAERRRLRADLESLLSSPARLSLRLEGKDVLIEAEGGSRRRVTPGEPHARVDELGTAEISSSLRGTTLTVREEYRRKTENREVYALDAGKGLLQVTRTVRRPGLPAVVVRSTYHKP